MNIKEAIKFLEDRLWIYSLSGKAMKKTKEVIKLLKRNEKFEKMWVGLCERAYRVDGGFPDIHDIIETLEVKYFPETHALPNNKKLMKIIDNSKPG